MTWHLAAGAGVPDVQAGKPAHRCLKSVTPLWENHLHTYLAVCDKLNFSTNICLT